VIVGLGHVKEVGKDTAAAALVRDLGFRRDGFADDLKELALRIDPLVVPEPELVNVSSYTHLARLVRTWGWEYVKKNYPEARRFLQNLGNEMREMFGEAVWIRRVAHRISDPPFSPVTEHVVIPDVRHLNEAFWVKATGGLLIKVTRPGYSPQGHVSELDLADYDGWDLVVQNDSDVVTLERTVVDYVSSVLKPFSKSAGATQGAQVA
jgi:hypothetical protein